MAMDINNINGDYHGGVKAEPDWMSGGVLM